MSQESFTFPGEAKENHTQSLWISNRKNELMFIRWISGGGGGVGWNIAGRATCAKTSRKGLIMEFVIC